MDSVLSDLFSRLPTRDVAFGCRGASTKWARLVENDEARWQQRVARLRLVADDDLDVAGAKRARRTALDECVALLKNTHVKWHREVIMRSYRRAFVTDGGGAALCDLWRTRRDNVERSATDVDQHTVALTRAMDDFCVEARDALQQRVLEDANDLSAERHCLLLECRAHDVDDECDFDD